MLLDIALKNLFSKQEIHLMKNHRSFVIGNQDSSDSPSDQCEGCVRAKSDVESTP